MAKPNEVNDFTERDDNGTHAGIPESCCDEVLTDFDYQSVGDYDDLGVEEAADATFEPLGEEEDIHGCPLFEMGRFIVLEDDPERERVFGGHVMLSDTMSDYSPERIALLPESFKAGTQIIILEPDVKSRNYKRANYSY